MSKLLTGTVVPSHMKNTIVVEVTRRTPHPLYGKLLKQTKRYKVHTSGGIVMPGETVQIVEIKPLSNDKHFKLVEKAENSKPKSKTQKSSH